MKGYRGISDFDLMELVGEGEMPALAALISRHEKQVVKTVAGMLGKCPEVADVSQETFIRFYRSLDNFKHNSSVGTYIVRIAINLSLNEIKRKKRKNFLFLKNDDENILQIPDADSSRHQEKNDLKEIVNRAVQLLEPKYRSVIVLKLIDGYSTEEAAEILEIKKSSVLTRLLRAQAKLRVKLKAFLEE